MIHHRSRYLIALLLLALAAAPLAAQAGAEKCTIQIIEPLAKQQVATALIVNGTATLPPGDHLWVFIRLVEDRSNSMWYPQKEGYFIDPNGHEWEAKALLAPGANVGDWFDVTATVVSQTQHAALKQHMDQAQVTGNWTPIPMPRADCVASMMTVRKTKD